MMHRDTQSKIGNPKSKIVVSGLINIETTVRVEGFPIDYTPVRYPFFGVQSSVSGVGYNVAKALTTLGDEVRFLSLIGDDNAGGLVTAALAADGIPAAGVLPQLAQTAQSAILYDPTGRRMINTDLKDVQEQIYPPDQVRAALAGCDMAALCNVNFSRPMLAHAQAAGVPIATDVHTIADLDDPYNRDFMAAAHLLAMSDEHLPVSPEAWVGQLVNRYGTQIALVGLGGDGCLLWVKRDNFLERIPAVFTRPVVNTIGAGDALFSSFLHFFAATGDPYAAIQRAVIFASFKIGETEAAAGFLDEAGMTQFVPNLSQQSKIHNPQSTIP
ncbi:MAG: carbohydrate kinase family protein [Caldilineaceae bacterium]|nr:carbohydrate kinase family protein [Caldilineaceae bacterium]MBP8109279.1 carbohydrate kinase family protein [Caldilineaceae bacterium]MBP8123890.1 carbohydrate kinase family protein [Caldilineaceae bacterium]MBP9071819.1 carbohydrate kinase family protein [Caldilineaceae bacterium]